MAARAHASYVAGNYDEALSHLPRGDAGSSGGTSGSGESGGGSDFRTLHNRALCEHGARGFSDPGKLEATLRAIQVRLRGRGRGGGGSDSEDDDDDGDDEGEAKEKEKAAGSLSSLGSSGRGEGGAAATAGLADLSADASVLLYNLSALRFQQKQYGAAQAVLEHLFLHIEPLDESLAIHICLLLLDVLCHSARGNLHTEDDLRRFSAQSAAVLAFLERPHALNSSSSGGGDGGGGGDTGRQDDGGGSGGGSAEQTEFTFRLHLYKAKALLLQEQTKTSKKEIKSALEIFQRELRGSSDVASNAAAGGGGGVQHQGTFAPVPPVGVQNMAALYLKANLEHLRDNHRKTLKLLASCHGFQGAEEYSGPGEAVGPPYFNNMGCLHHKLRRHHVALHYFQKALEALSRGARSTKENGTAPTTTGSSSGRSRGGRRAGGVGSGGGGGTGWGGWGSGGGCEGGHVSPEPTCEVLYNAGLQLLLMENPEQALRCFERAALLFHNRPHLWLRMAECSIIYHRLRSNNSCGGGGGGSGGDGRDANRTPGAKEGCADTGTDGGGRGPLPWTSIGKGQHRRILLPGGSYEGRECGRGDGGAANTATAGGEGSAIPSLDEEGVVESNGAVGDGAGAGGGARTGKGRRGTGGGGCSLAHASRCLHNVLYLCAARAQEAKAAAAAEATGLLGGQASVLGASTRLVAKNLSAKPPPRQAASASGNTNASASGGRAEDGGDGDATNGGSGGDGSTSDGAREHVCRVALLDLAYVHLGLNDPVAALSYAGRALSSTSSAVTTHLAHLYAAEALCILGRPAEALEHLAPLSEASSAASAAAGAWSGPQRPYPLAAVTPSSAAQQAAATAAATAAAAAAATSTGNSTGNPAGGNTAGNSTGNPGGHAAGNSAGNPTGNGGNPGNAAGNPGNAVGGAGGGVRGAGMALPGVGTEGVLLSARAEAEARASLHANLAAVHALQGNLGQAERCARMAMGVCPGSAPVLRMAVYVFIRQGNVAEALQVLKEGRLSHK